MNEAIQLLKEIQKDKRFYGSITFKFEAGKIVYIREERGYKPTKESEK